VPDPMFVGLLSAAMACLMIALFAEQAGPGWAIAFYCFVGLATLSKGLLGFALPGAVTLLYCIATGEWHRLRRLRLITATLSVLSRRAIRPQTTRDRALFFVLLWVLIGFAVFAVSATKFHHYAFPVMPPLLLLCGMWLERVLDEGLRAHAGEVFTGALLYALV